MPITDRATDNFRRLFRVLQLLPRAPRWIDTGTLADLLLEEGFTNVRRTLQRDLIKLERMGFGIQALQGTKPYRWRLMDGARLPVVPSPPDTLRTTLIELTLWVRHEALTAFTEEPLSSRQRVQNAEAPARSGGGSEDAILQARVPMDGKLRARILSLGHLVEVMEPVVLRDEIAAAHRAAWERYARARRPVLVGSV